VDVRRPTRYPQHAFQFERGCTLSNLQLYLFLAGLILTPLLIPLLFVDQFMIWLMRIGGVPWKEMPPLAKWQTFMLGFDVYLALLALSFAGAYAIPPHYTLAIILATGSLLLLGIINCIYDLYRAHRFRAANIRYRAHQQWKRDHPHGTAADYLEWKRDRPA